MCIHKKIYKAIQFLCNHHANYYLYNKFDPFLYSSINAIKEVTARCPLAITEDLLQDLAQYKTHKDKSECLPGCFSCHCTFVTVLTALFTVCSLTKQHVSVCICLRCDDVCQGTDPAVQES